MSSQAAQLKLNGRFFDLLTKRGSFAIATSFLGAFAYYIGVYRRRKNLFAQDFAVASSEEEVTKIADRMAKFGLTPGPGPSLSLIEKFDDVKADETGSYLPVLQTYESEISTLPKEKQELARQIRSQYLAELLPVNNWFVAKVNQASKGMSEAEQYKLMSTEEVKAGAEGAILELKESNITEINKGLARLLKSKVGLEV